MENELDMAKKKIKNTLDIIEKENQIKVKVVLDNRKGRKRELYIKTPKKSIFIQMKTDCLSRTKTLFVKEDKEAIQADKIDEETLELIDKLTRKLDEEIEKRGKVTNLDTTTTAIIKYEAEIP